MSSTPRRHVHFGIVLFSNAQLIDFAGPYEVWSLLPNVTVHLVADTLCSIRTVAGLFVQPTITLDKCPPLDVLNVPGGSGANDCMSDLALLAFLKRQAKQARFVTSVCTGAFVLGAAGLLEGKRVTTHWAYVDLLTMFGAIPVAGERIVEDGNIITGGGATSGIDFALRVAARLRGEAAAKTVQLLLEYDPKPPFDCGAPAKAEKHILQAAVAEEAPYRKRREDLLAKITGRPVPVDPFADVLDGTDT